MPNDCLLCGGADGATFFEENGYAVRRCADCGLLFVPDPPAHETLKEMYDEEKWIAASGEVSRDDTAYHRNEAMLIAVADDGLDYVRDQTGVTSGRVLDIGTGDGYFMEAAARRGFECAGVELSATRVARGRARGLTIHHGDLLDLDLPAASFDVVSCRDILSHVTKPLEMMRETRRLLAPGGVVFVQTGNKAELQTAHDGRALFDFWGVPGHLSFFGQPQLERAFRESGLRTGAVRRIPYLTWQLAPLLLRQREGRYRPVRYALAAVPPIRVAVREAYRRYWYRGRPESAALWVLAVAA